MIIKCVNPKCKNVWDYKGKSKFYASCSICKSSIRVPKLFEKTFTIKAKMPINELELLGCLEEQMGEDIVSVEVKK